MSDQPSSDSRQQAWWAAIAALVAVVMVMKPTGNLMEGHWRWVVGALGVVMVWRMAGVLGSSSSSPGRILSLLALVAMAGSVAVVGIPTHWFRVPAWSEVASVVTPLLLGAAALLAVLFGLAGLNRRRELTGAPQRAYVPILLNLIIVAAAWQVVRQPLWKESLEGMLKLPQLHSNRVAFEESITPWVDIIQHRQPATPGGTVVPRAATRANSTTPSASAPSLAERDRKTVISTHPLGIPKLPLLAPGTRSGATPANAEQWVQAAVHNPENPLLELKASIALVADGRADQALSRLAAARQRGCQSAELIRFHAHLLQDEGRPAAAATVLESLVVSAEGTDQDLHECLSAWEQAGQSDRAENLAERLLVKRPSRDLFRWMATRDAAEGRYERALVLLGQLSRRSPFDSADAFQLAEVALRAGRPELALDAVNLLEGSGHRSIRLVRLAERAKASAIAESSRSTRGPTPRAGR